MEPICRDWVLKGNCKRGNRCRFRHPVPVGIEAKRRATRPIGRCFCGAPQACFVRKIYRDESDDRPTFYIVCGRTKKSMRRCM